MGTSWSVQFHADVAASSLDRLESDITALLGKLDRDVFSTYSPASEISRLNNGPAGQWQPLSEDMVTVLAAASRLHAESGGAFDPTIGPLVDLWGFGPEAGGAAVPSADRIAQLRTVVGMTQLQFDGSQARLRRRAEQRIDLSAIAKGYAVDRVAGLLESRGITDYLVEIGGELRARGGHGPEQGWLIGIETPRSGPRQAHAAIDTGGQPLALAGSGSYRNFRVVDGAHYSHAIDPRSGYPVTHRLAAVTVLADSAMLADGWATALMILGPEAGPALAEMRGIAAYFIMPSGEGFRAEYTEPFAPYLGSFPD